MWIEIFRAGTHTSAEGISREYTEKDLDTMVSKYNDQKAHEAPLVIGHPKTNDPAYGWVKELKREGTKLLAFVEAVSDKVVAAVRAKMFKKVSIAVYGDLMLRHVGLLGAVPPAVKDLASVEFAADLQFEEFHFSTRESAWSRLRDFIAEKFGQETADKVIPAEPVLDMKIHHSEEDTIMKEELEKLQKTVLEYGESMKKMGESMTAMDTALKAERDERAAEQLRFAEALKKKDLDGSVEKFSVFCDGLIRDGKVLPAEKDKLVEEYRDTYLANSQLTFKENEKSLLQRFEERLSARPVIVKPNDRQFIRKESDEPNAEFACFGESIDDNGVTMDAAIRKIAEERKLSYEEAMTVYMTH